MRDRFLRSSILVLAFLVVFSFYFIDVEASSLSVYKLVNFGTKSSNVNTNFTEDGTNRSGYLNGTYGVDAIYLGTNNGRVKFKMAGVVGYVNSSDVEVVNMNSQDDYDNYSTSFYTVSNGIIVHKIANSVRGARYSSVSIGPNNINLKEGVHYLSYDGHYFYEDSLKGYKNMADDYNNGTSKNAINYLQPYYNYYQFLSHRSITNYTTYDIENYITSVLGYNSKVSSYEGLSARKNESQLYNEQNAFIDNQNVFGANAIMMFGVAVNESAYGRSSIAFYKNNLFGHSAYDATPGSSANGYKDVASSIWAHANIFISQGYMDPKDYNARYNGGHFGDKSSGFNIKYASDPYWGEKNAQYYFNFDRAYGYQDYGKYKIGIKTSHSNYSIRKEPNTSSNVVYSTGVSSNYPVVILAEVTGEVVDGNNLWYKIQADPVLSSDRSKFIQDKGEYDFNNNYLYIHSSSIDIVMNGGKSYINKSYVITFDANGGSFEDGSSSKKMTVSSGTLVSVSNPTRDGYEFVGWDSKIDAASSDKTYKAVWKDVRKYEIVFDANGGKFDDNTSVKKINAAYNQNVSVSNPTRDGYEFVDWDSKVSPATSNKTYKAVWKKVVTYQITFDANGGVFANSKNKSVLSVRENEIPSISNPSRTGYRFVGWDSKIGSATCDKTYKAVWKKMDDNDIYNLTNKSGNFYFSYLDVLNNKLVLQGYQTILGIQNNLSNDIKYKIEFENIDDNSLVYYQDATRITNKSNIPKLVYSPDGKDYTYSWFNATIDMDKLKPGNYKAYVIAFTSNYYSKSLITNKIYKKQVTNYKGNSTYSIIRNNYNSSNSFVEFKVRNEALATKNSSYIYNQYDKYVKFEFSNNKLHIRGTSYSYGMDLSKNKSVSRKIIFENTETFKKYSYDIGSITNGDYKVYLPVEDNLGKDRAWYDSTFDISNIPQGEYVIYITTTSNITDISELSEKLGRSLSGVVKKINNRTYSFNINRSYGNRIELIVK